MANAPKLPTRLYKYRTFNAQTLHLLTEGESYYAEPSSFNDALDCRPVIAVDTDVKTLEKLCYRMLVLAQGKDRALSRIGNFRYLSTEYCDYLKDTEARECYSNDLRREIRDLLYAEMRRHGVLSLAARWNCSLMWSHYADEHRGMCIEYDMTDHKCNRLLPVNYTASGTIRISDIHNWKVGTSKRAERLVREAFFYAKAKDWRYEREWRDVVDGCGSVDSPVKLSGVHFGLRCDQAVRTCVVMLFRSAPAIKLYDIFRKDDALRLQRRSTDRDEIEACGLHTSRGWEFDKFGE